MILQNPIITGFNPDPSICRVGDDYYIATFTFEWFPEVQIHHSKDLVNWRLLGRALDRVSQLDMRGCQNSAGIWAPCLTHADRIEGPWSEPVFLNASGFDPSLFHDDDWKKYVVQMQMGEALTPTRFDGIWLREHGSAIMSSHTPGPTV